jgi:hypothetical protein
VFRSSLIALALVTVGFGPAFAQQVRFRAPRTLARSVDTVVLSGADSGRAKGHPIASIRAYALRLGVMTPISYQIDERNQVGTWCWTQGPLQRRLRDSDRGKLDSNDEVVFLVRDAGDQALPQQLFQVPGAIGYQEIQISDPRRPGKAWVYLYLFTPQLQPGRVTGDYARLRVKNHPNGEKTHYWYGESFCFNNNRSRNNAVRATYAGFAAPGTTDYSKVPNLIDSTQVKAVVSFMWVTLTRHSHDFKIKLGGWIDGPLRVIAENRLKVRLAMGYWVEAPDSYLILWRNKMSMPTNAACPVNLDTSDESNYTLCVDMNKAVKGLKFFNSHNKKPVIIDGKMSPAEKAMNLAYPKYNVLYGPSGAMITKFVIPNFLRRKKGSKLIYLDDLKRAPKDDSEGIEFQKGAYGYNGYVMDMRGLKKGLYPGDYVVWYAPPGFKPGDERGYLEEYSFPVEIEATSVKR